MKKIFMFVLLIVVTIAIILALHNTNKKAAQTVQINTTSKDVASVDITITDNYFIQSINDVYLNIDSYVGKTVKIEGFIYEYTDNSGVKHVAVIRNTPGCCGNDGLAGLDIEYENYPSHGTWVEAIGTIKKISIDGQPTPMIEVTSLTKKPEGKTFVTN